MYMHIYIYIFTYFTQNSSSSRFEIVMRKFSPLCKRYTDAMAHKYYLQHLLFNKAIDPAVTKQLTSVIVRLQAMVNSIENVQVRMLCTLKHSS